MFKQTKKILAILLSIILAFSVAPTIVLSATTETNVTISDVTDSAILNNLSVSASVPTTLKTQIGTDEFAGRKENNLVARAQILGFTVDPEGKTPLKKTAGSNSGKDVILKPETLSNGKVAYFDGVNTEPSVYLTDDYRGLDKNYGYLTIELDSVYNINDLYISTGARGSKNVIYNYEIYISSSTKTLYNDENKVISYHYSGYSEEDIWAGKINQNGLVYAEDGSVSYAAADASEFILNNAVKGQYVGFYFKAFGMQENYERVFELGIEGLEAENPLKEEYVASDVTDEATLSNLKVSAAVPTTLKTQFGRYAFKSRRKNNLLKNATEFSLYSDSKLTKIMAYNDKDELVSLNLQAMHDEIMSTNLDESTRITDDYNAVKSEPGYFFIDFADTQYIGTFYIATSENCKHSLDDYELYVSDNKEDLFSVDNRIIDFVFDGYVELDYSTKINKVVETDPVSQKTIYPSEVHEYKFSTPAIGRYVGIKANSFGVARGRFVRISEVGFEKFEYFHLDESNLNVNLKINPLERYLSGENYSFEVSIENGGILNHLYLDGEEILPDVNGVYTIKNATSDMKLTADFEIDTKKTLSLGVGADETQRNITWHSTSNTIGKVQYAIKNGDIFPATYFESEAEISISENDVGYYINKAVISNLHPDTEYVYRLVNDNVSPIYSFKTDPEGDFSFLFAGDPQVGVRKDDAEEWDKNITKAAAQFPEANLLVTAGDQVNDCEEAEYVSYLNPDVMSSYTNAITVGNHESRDISLKEHFYVPNDNIDGVYYGVTTAGENFWYVYNNVLFLCINTNNKDPFEHEAFIEKAIAANPDVDWTVVVTHMCIYTGGKYFDVDYMVSLREDLVPVFEKFDIDVVLTGHNHVYTRTYVMNGFEPDSANGPQSKVVDPTGIVYITANSASGSKYYDLKPETPTDHVALRWQGRSPSITNVEVTEGTFKMTTYNLDNMSVIDEFEIEKTVPHKHSPEYKKANAASCKKAGNVEYWECSSCEMKFSDADCENEITNATIPKLSHKDKTTTAKATTSKNGSIVKKCSVCGTVSSTTTIKYAKTFKISTSSYTYSGKEKKPTVKVYDSAGKLISSSNYTLSYKNNKNVGKATVTVKFKGNYSGSKTLNFTINPKSTSISKLTAAKKSLKVSIKKRSSQVTGYEVQYSTSKKFSGAKTKTIKSYKTTSLTIKSLKAKKTYYVRVRTYKTVGGKKYYSGWSSYKSKKTK